MLLVVKTPVKKIEKYKGLIPDNLFKEINNLAKELKGLKVVHINATPRGGGVAEILKSLVPMMRGVGLKAGWYINPPGERFFTLTKQIHNALQGEEFKFPFSARKLYIRHMEKTAKLMQDMRTDLWVIHDPQPVGVAAYLSDLHPSIWRVHIDTSHPNQEAWGFIHPFMLMYDKIVFTSKEFIGPSLPKSKVTIFPPAIDPLTIKNIPLDLSTSRNIVESLGVDLNKPLVVQTGRFDPWKDPLGAVEAYQIAKKKIPNLQLAFLGLFLAGEVGGIKLQIKDGKNGFLVSNPKEAAKRIVQLIENPKLTEKLGKAAKETVREKFLIPRLLRDYLRLFKKLV